jgi:hypothetical protein
MTDGRVSQGAVRTLTEGNDLRLSSLGIRTIYNFPSEESRISSVTVRSLDESFSSSRISQSVVRSIIRGRVDQPKVRAWTFTLDGHDFYVLRLGDTQTFVYDVYSQQWTRWYSSSSNRWRFTTGQNWQGSGAYQAGFGSNIVTGDDTFGVLWMLDPAQSWDEDPQEGDEVLLPFVRKATGQVTSNMRKTVPCFEVYLTADAGYAASISSDVTLSTSDDNGNTYAGHGAITATPGNYSQEFAWRSLGQIRDPGRLFLIEDEGALQRINSLDISVGPER